VTDTWAFSNIQAYIAMTINFKINGILEMLLLDIMGYACSHNGANPALTFEKILRDFGISNKVHPDKKTKTEGVTTW
jgi:hypothetical protein